MTNVLVFPCGSEIGLEVYRSLQYSKHFKVFGASTVEDHGRMVYENYLNLPSIESDEIITVLNEVIKEHEIDFVIPAHDSVILKFAREQKNINAIILTSPVETCEICRSKLKTYQLFKNKIPVPKLEPLKYPMFMKPDVGQGSKRTKIVFNTEDWDFYSKKDPDLITLEYLPGKEYTVDCFTSKGKLLFVGGRERKRILNGISVNSTLIDHIGFCHLAKIINKTLRFDGAWFFQVKERKDGELVLMEIAPRIGGTSALNRVRGINFVQLSLFDRMGVNVEIIKNEFDVEIDRALTSRFKTNLSYKKVFIDLDDTIIQNDKVNPAVMQFLFQCHNEKKQIIVLTRNREGNNLLVRHCISLYMMIKLIYVTDEKVNYIEPDSIFIDDSFSERKKVFDKGIPVFDIDAIECLMK